MFVHRLATESRRHLALVQPATVVHWHHEGWRLFWRYAGFAFSTSLIRVVIARPASWALILPA